MEASPMAADDAEHPPMRVAGGATLVAPVPGGGLSDPEEVEEAVPEAVAALPREREATTWSLPGTPAAPPPRPRPTGLFRGARLGRWILDRPLGEGATAAVWAAHHEELGAPVAIKVFHRRNLPFQTVLGEARAAAGIPSRHVAWVYDADTYDGYHAIVMELVGDAEHAARSLREEVVSSPREAARLAAEAARGVQAAHEGGVFHKDIKPANVLVNPSDRRAQITDFGLANPALWVGVPVLGAHSAHSTVCVNQPAEPLTMDDPCAPIRGDLRIGTPEFMAPEQAAGLRRDLDPDSDVHRPFLVAIDVYGLGATLYHLLAGHPPFPHRAPDCDMLDAAAIMAQVVEGPPEPLPRVAPQVPRRLAAIVARAMHVDPRERYPSALAMAEDLEAWVGERPTSLDASPLVRAGVHLWRERVRVGLLAALALVTVGSFAVVASNVLTIADQDAVLVEKRAELERLSAEREALSADLATTREQLEQRDGMLERTGQALAAREASLATTSTRLESTSAALSSATTDLDLARARVGELETVEAELRRELADTTGELARATDGLATARSQLADAAGKVEGLGRRLGDMESELRERGQRIDALAANEAAVRERLAMVERERTALQRRLREAELEIAALRNPAPAPVMPAAPQ